MAELYAIVDSPQRARFMLEAGVSLVQFRLKSSPLAPHIGEISALTREFPASRIIINDDLEFALKAGAWGVHLGQEDLARYNPGELLSTPLRLGISTHSDEEIGYALSFRPEMLGFGPIFSTSTKELAYRPQGVARLREVVAKSPLPVVAIGGIDRSNMKAVAATGVAMVAMIGFLDNLSEKEQVKDVVKTLRDCVQK